MSASCSWPFFEKVTGLRMNHNYIRPGGVAADLPDGWRDDVAAICEAIPRRLDEYDSILTGQPIFQDRQQGIGPLSADEAIALGVTGPLLRSAGVAWDLRRDMPYLAYDQVEFDVIVGHRRVTAGTATRSGSTRPASRSGSSARSST